MVSVCGGSCILVNNLTLKLRQRLRHLGRSVIGILLIALFIGQLTGGAVLAQSEEGSAADAAETSRESIQDVLPQNPITRPLRDLAPPGVTSIFNNDFEAEAAPVWLDGRSLFQVAAPTETVSLSASERAREIEQRLKRIARNDAHPGSIDSLDVAFEIDQESNQPVVTVNGEPVMTVTYLDARLNGSNSLTLRASQIAETIENALIRFYAERRPDYLWRQLRWTLATLFITVLGSFAISHFQQNLRQRRRKLKQAYHQRSTAAEPSDGVDLSSMNTIRTTLLTRQKINSLGVIRQVLQLLQIALWVASALLVVGLFPYTRWLQPLVINTMRIPVRFFLIGLVAYGLIRISNIWIDRLFIAFQSRTAATIERSQRLVLRLSTFSQVIKGIIAFFIAGIAFLIMLSLLGVRVGPLLAGAGLLGFAVSFASQSLIKDIINGFLVLLEDQYGVGDVITARNMTGFVETMNLRITQLRATDGQLITIPNGQIDIVQNLSKEWSRVDLMIPVGLEADIDQALQLVETVANEMRRDSIWGALILEPPLLLGVDELSHAGAIIRIWIKTQPLKQWDVAREYRRRLKIAFKATDIPIGVPQQMVQLSSPLRRAPLGAHDPTNGDSSTAPEPPSVGMQS